MEPGDQYFHYKNGICTIFGVAEHTERDEPLVVYKSEDGKVWARPKSAFDKPISKKNRRPQFTKILKLDDALGLIDEYKPGPNTSQMADGMYEAAVSLRAHYYKLSRQFGEIDGNLRIAVAMLATEMEKTGGFEEVLARPAVRSSIRHAREYLKRAGLLPSKD